MTRIDGMNADRDAQSDYFQAWRPSLKPISASSFAKYGKFNDKLAVYFWASWNIYDRQYAATMTSLRNRLQGWIDFRECEFDAPENIDWSSSLGIHTGPTLVVFVNGNVKRVLVGLTTEQTLAREVLNALSVD